MGMFDYVVCNYQMPEGYDFLQKSDFQTKDFESVMDKYTITEDGLLVHHKYMWDMVAEKDRPYYGKPEWDTKPIFKVMGSIKMIYVGDEEMNYHGYFTFYTSVKDGTYINEDGEVRDKYKFYDLKAKFTDGKLVELKVEKENG
ncbi:MAG: hypothetical protein DRO67_06395 [Candidatus Asgardarchaeum californiense]|nr:MAG: hypothetical protein DRO67_06395 [Candidatus Asgardarchaeum californiense]